MVCCYIKKNLLTKVVATPNNTEVYFISSPNEEANVFLVPNPYSYDKQQTTLSDVILRPVLKIYVIEIHSV